MLFHMLLFSENKILNKCNIPLYEYALTYVVIIRLKNPGVKTSFSNIINLRKRLLSQFDK